MSRKKLNGFVILGILLCYVICLIGSYNLAKEYVAKDFENSIENLIVDFEKKYSMENNIRLDSVAFSISPENLMGEFLVNGEHDYPWSAAILDSNGNIAAKSSSWMYIYDKQERREWTINWDEYFTEEQWGQIDDFWEEIEYPVYISHPYGREYVGYGLDFCIKDDELVPVRLQMVELERPEHILTLELTDNIADHHFCGNMLDFEADEDLIEHYQSDGEYYIPIADESIPNKTDVYMKVHFPDVDKHGRNRELYHELSEQLNEENIKNNISLKLNASQSHMEGTEYWYEGYFQIEGKFYTIYLLAKYSEFDEVIRSEVFLNAIRTQSILLLLLGVILLIIVNYLYMKNQKLGESRQMFTSAVAHELKTPVAIIQNQCECILEDIAPEKNREYVKSVYDEATAMNKMIVSFLQYNRLQTTTRIDKEKCDLYKIVCAGLQKYEDLMESANLKLVTELTSNAEVYANKELLSLVVGNYLSNAYKYTDEGCTVKVTLRQVDKGYYFSVFNEGASIAEDFSKEIWDVLSREDQARNRKMGSSGMGLPICRKILELHGYEYGYRTTEEGVEFYLGT